MASDHTMLTPNKLLLTPNNLLLTPDEMTITKASVKKRAAMSKQSPYAKSVAKAGKTVPKKAYTAKEVASAAKFVQGKRTPTKKERLDAKARARAWAKREFGQKRKSIQPSDSSQSVIAKDADDVVDLTKNESINKEMVNALDEVGRNDNQFIIGDISEDVFFDALEFLEDEGKQEQEDIFVEDASDDDDDDDERTIMDGACGCFILRCHGCEETRPLSLEHVRSVLVCPISSSVVFFVVDTSVIGFLL